MNDKQSQDAALFRELMGDVTPLKNSPRVTQARKADHTPGLQQRRRAAGQVLDKTSNHLAPEEFITPVKPRDVLDFKRDGVQHGVYKKLRLGKYQVDSRLDMHRLTVNQARNATAGFIRDCMAYQIRCCLITHGRGECREKPALLKSCVNHWLQQLEDVLAFHSAQPQHGGTGATYVLLRKSETKRQENKEKYSKGRS